MQTNRLAALVLAAVLGLATVGCGSSDGDEAASTTTAAPTGTADGGEGGDAEEPEASAEKTAFIEAADKICKESGDQIEQKADELDQTTDIADAELEAFFAMAAQETNAQITAVRELGFPEEDADELDQAFTVLEDAFAAVSDDPKSLLDQTSTPEFEEATAYLDAYGFEECGASD